MSQLTSVRSNQSFGLNHQTKELVPITELIILTTVPEYTMKKDKITHGSKVQELRFFCGSEGIRVLIEQLEQAKANMVHYEKMALALKDLTDTNHVAGDVVGDKQ